MFSRMKRLLEQRHTLSFRLTLWYAAIFLFSSIVAFGSCYLMVASYIKGLTDKELMEEIVELSGVFKTEGIEGLKREIKEENKSEDIKKIFYRLISKDQKVIATTDMSYWKGLRLSNDIFHRFSPENKIIYQTLYKYPGRHTVRVANKFLKKDILLQIGIANESEAKFIGAFKRIIWGILLIIVPFSTLIGLFMAKRSLKGVDEVTKTALEIQKGAMGKRVPIKSRGLEVETLATAFNRMLDKVDDLIRQMKDMNDNIAHELRTPITSIRGMSELILASNASIEEYRALAGSIIEQCDRLLNMVNTLLDIAEAESGIISIEGEHIDISELVIDCYELFEPVAEEKGVSIYTEVEDGLMLKGNREGLQRVIANLLDNAIKYTPSGGTVQLEAKKEKDKIIISIADTGIGIPKEDLPKIFERFYRGSYTRSKDGIGLGLSLARAIVSSHGGVLRVKSRVGEGSLFTVIIPA